MLTYPSLSPIAGDLVNGLFLLFISLTLVVLGYGAYNLFLHPLRFYPGPKLWAAYHLPWMRSVLSGRYPFEALELHKKYGSVVRVAPNELSYTDSAAWKAICGDHNSVTEGFFEMGKDFRNFHRPVNGVLSMIAADTTTHARFRRLFSHSFSEKGLRDMQPRIRRYVDLLIQGLRKNCDEGHLDIVEWYNWTAFDLVGDLAFGESFDCLQNQKTNDWVSAIFGNVKAAACLSALERYGLKRLVPLIVPKRLIEFRELNARRNAEQIDRRIELGTGRGDFWDEVLAKSDFEKGSGMTRAEMVSNAGLLVLAGSETTATLLSGTTYLLLKHPLVMRKLVNEVRGAFKSEDEIDLVSVNKLNYMLAVLDESMRIYPPVPHQGNRIVPVPGAMICGKWVPPRTNVIVQRYSINRLSFTRPEDFVPERWLPDAPAEFAKDDRSAPQSFSLGPRNCIGRNLAYAEMQLILARLCWNFDLELDEKRCGDWMSGQKSWILWEKPPLWIKIRPVNG